MRVSEREGWPLETGCSGGGGWLGYGRYKSLSSTGVVVDV